MFIMKKKKKKKNLKCKPFPNLGLTQSREDKNIVPIIEPIPFFLHTSKIVPTAGPGTVIINNVVLVPSI